MLIYWLMFAFPAALALLQGPRHPVLHDKSVRGFGIVFLVYAVLVGLRYELGADARNYDDIAAYLGTASLREAIAFADPAFSIITWISMKLGWEIYGASLVSAVLLMYGVLRFCRRQADPWLALAAAVPYLIIVVGIGYIRQAAAIGIILLAILQYERGNTLRYFGLVALAILYHASAFIMVPFGALTAAARRPLVILPLALLTAVFYFSLFADKLDVFRENYIVNPAGMDSSGALVRQVMSGVPAIFFLLVRKKIALPPRIKLFWTAMAATAVLFIILAAVLRQSSTLLDRLGLYLIPIQLLVAGNLTVWMARSRNEQLITTVCVLAFYALSLFVWLVFATHAEYWLPYRWWPWVWLFD